jgi:hypothetical protein
VFGQSEGERTKKRESREPVASGMRELSSLGVVGSGGRKYDLTMSEQEAIHRISARAEQDEREGVQRDNNCHIRTPNACAVPHQSVKEDREDGGNRRQ